MKAKIREWLIRVWAKIRTDAAPKVVFYHDIGRKYTGMGTDTDVFRAHMKLLRDGDVVCFDDGFRGIWDVRDEFCGGRFGEDGKARTIVFLAVDLVGQNGYLTWDEVKTLQDEHGIEFQSHTWSHQTLAGPYNDEVPAPSEGRTEEWYRHELAESKAELERRLGKAVSALCFPVGHFSDDVIRRCRDAGYKKVYASFPGNVTDAFIQPRCLVQDLSTKAFKAVLNGGMMVFGRRYRMMHYLAR